MHIFRKSFLVHICEWELLLEFGVRVSFKRTVKGFVFFRVVACDGNLVASPVIRMICSRTPDVSPRAP